MTALDIKGKLSPQLNHSVFTMNVENLHRAVMKCYANQLCPSLSTLSSLTFVKFRRTFVLLWLPGLVHYWMINGKESQSFFLQFTTEANDATDLTNIPSRLAWGKQKSYFFFLLVL